MTEQKSHEELRHFLGFLGLCRRAQKLICGTPMVCTALSKSPKPCLVLYSKEASTATKKRLITKSAFYGVDAYAIPTTPEALAHAIGKTGCLAAVAVTDSGFAEALRKKLSLLPTEQEIAPSPVSPEQGEQNLTGKDASAARKSRITI